MPPTELNVDARLSNVQPILQSLGKFKESAQRRILRSPTRKSATVLNKTVKQEAKKIRRSGTLWKSIGIKLKSYKNTGTVVALVGARTNFEQTISIPPQRVFRWIPKGKGSPGRRRVQIPRPRAEQLEEVVIPTKYVHLIHNGTSTIPANPFITRSGEAKRGQMQGAFIAGVKEEITKEERKLAAAAAKAR